MNADVLTVDKSHNRRDAWLTLAGGCATTRMLCNKKLGTKTWYRSWLTLFATFGYANAFGVFQDFYQRSQMSSSSNISWIGSVQIFFLVATGLPAGRLLDMGYFKQIALGGSLLYIFS
jgi:hypothetical protein